ncbi:jg17330 [Pararge aegeria aegeria]|uniref:Jg17330 protein n=1 Tax=Pararge aegeria aegeria TaxID=348720 RepID=A0A8S4SKU3_9NEOP|nr:jg17330 [Pararge aegeria aegeria]
MRVVDHTAQRADGHRTSKRSAYRPPTRWTNNIKRIAGSRWIKAAQDHKCGDVRSEYRNVVTTPLLLAGVVRGD